MASNICKLLFNWTADKLPSLVTKFTYLDVTDKLTEEVNVSPETERLTDDTGLTSDTQLWLSKTGGDDVDTHCVLQITCSSPSIAQINGFSVLSESRTIEVSSEEKGYLTTVRGRSVKDSSGRGQAESDTKAMYLCTCYFEDNYPNLNLKFLSLAGRQKLCVNTIAVNISQHDLQSKPNESYLNVERLKKDIEDMGSVMSDRAKDFMSTLEQYDKNKMTRAAEGLMGIGQPFPSNGLSNIMSNILGVDTMQHLSGAGLSANQDKPDIFNILNSVCGSISSKRMAAFKQPESSVTEEEDSSSPTPSQSLGADSGHAASQDLDSVPSMIVEKMEQLQSDVREELAEMRQEMLSKIDSVKSELDQKLDLILQMLEGIKSSQEKT